MGWGQRTDKNIPFYEKIFFCCSNIILGQNKKKSKKFANKNFLQCAGNVDRETGSREAGGSTSSRFIFYSEYLPKWNDNNVTLLKEKSLFICKCISISRTY